jgi:hypothetical protein
MATSPTMPVPGLVPFEDLQRCTGYERPADVRRVLDRDGIRYFLGRGGAIWTTLDLVNQAGGMVRGDAARATLDPEGFR